MNKNATGGKTPFYITTAIPYVNAEPHVGFAYELLLADAQARFHRLKGDDVRFVTGTDENSLKNVQAAEREGLPVRDLVDRNAAKFSALKEVLNLSFDDFIRTSADSRHFAAVNRIWEACDHAGDLYKRNYSGLYCVGCEQFYSESELENGCCKEHGTPPESVEEENYFFRLSRYEAQLLELVESDKLEIVPASRKAEVVSFIRAGLADFSVSRSRTRARGWGLAVPGDEDQVIYVWFDALVNYISALGYAEDSADFQRYWADCAHKVHAIGKGVTRFHAIYWPAILLSAGVPLPDKLYVHGYLTVDGRKIGKSAGNAINPVHLVETYGCDSVRHFLLRDFAPARDCDFTLTRLVNQHNSELLGKLGNLLNRTLTLVERNCEGSVPAPGAHTAQDAEFVQLASGLGAKVHEAAGNCEPDLALSAIFDVVTAANKYVSDEKPWVHAKTIAAGGEGAQEASVRVRTVLYNLVESLRLVAFCLAPFLPETAEKCAKQLGYAIVDGDFDAATSWGVTAPGTAVKADGLLFQKLERAG